MSTLRGRAERFTRSGQMLNDVVKLKIKPKSRLKTIVTKTPVIQVGNSVVLCLDLGSVAVIRDVLSSDFGILVEFHSTAACLDEDALIYSLDPADKADANYVQVLGTSPRIISVVQNGDATESPTIYVKITNSAFVNKQFDLRINYFDLSETVYAKIYPSVKISSNLLPLIVPRIKTPIEGFEFSRVLNEYSVDPVPRLVDRSMYIGYNVGDFINTYRHSGLLVAPSSVINDQFVKQLKFSPGFQLEGQYKIYFNVLPSGDPTYDLFSNYDFNFSTIPESSEVKIVFKDAFNEYTLSIILSTTSADLGKLASKMIVLNIIDGKFSGSPTIVNSDLNSANS